MASRHLSVRLPSDAFERLDAESRRSGRSRSEVAKELLEEGVRMRRHPGIVFRDAALGRQPALADGPKVWVVAEVLREVPGSGDNAIRETMELTELTEQQVRTVARYYAEFRQEIDGWLDRLHEEQDRAEEEWLRERALLAK